MKEEEMQKICNRYTEEIGKDVMEILQKCLMFEFKWGIKINVDIIGKEDK